MLKAYDNQHSLECHSKFRFDKGEILNRSISLKLLSRGLTISNIVLKSSIRDPENHSENLLMFERDIVPSPIDFNYELSEGAVLEVQDRIGRQFLNTVVGRYANRLPAGKSTLKLSDRSLDLDLDENGEIWNKALEMGEGETGNNGFDLKDFRQVGADSEIVKRFEEETRKSFKEKFENINRSRKSFREEIDEDNCHDKKVSYFYLKSPAGHQGFSSRLE
ncbi:hypothetical protein PPACK8108_LOCUS20074 [Phakopsora pachyrhizi]|uniref:Uncharacterized protein n=1 Tax=Phakopsora pachyrhizi TaxID=170000 RepID=A0AAV0BGR9_PHAPC|nr:hypothetical protein PPACK8108_LOCUS20074 [Phakopsora pachyrhizi]